MTKARILADFISDGSPLADGTISVAEVSGAAPLASPTFTGTVVATSLDISGDIDVDGTTNLDVVDIDGAVDMASTLGVTGAITGTTASFTRLDINATNTKLKGDLFAYTDASYDIGASGANRPRNLYLSSSITAGDITTTGAGVASFASGAVFNENSYDSDFRVESDTNANALFVEGSSGNVGIGTSSIGSSTKLQVAGRGLFTDGAIDPADGSPAGVTVGYNIAGDHGFIQSIHTGVANKPLYIQPNNSNVYISPNGGNVGIGTSSPLSKLNAKGTQGNWRVDPDSVSGEIQVLATTTINDGFRDFRIRTQQTIFDTAGSERMRIDSSGGLITKPAVGGHAVFNEDGVDADFRIESDTNANALFVQGSDGKVGIGKVPAQKFEVEGGRSIFTDANSNFSIGVKNKAGNYPMYIGATDSLLTPSLQFSAATGSPLMYLTYGGGLITNPSAGGDAVFNEGGVDADFRVESDTNAHMLFVDAGNNRVGVNMSNPAAPFHVAGGTSDTIAAANAIAKITANGLDGLAIGAIASAPYSAYLQSGYTANGYSPEYNNGYPLALNPKNGNVVIGATNVAASTDGLSVVGSSKDNISLMYTGTAGGHTSSIDFRDKRKVVNARINNLLTDDGVGTAGAHLDFSTAVGGTLSNRLRIGGTSQTEAVFNDPGYDYDFRVESDANTHMLVVDAGLNTVQLGTTLTFGGAVNCTSGGIGIGESGSAGYYRRVYWNEANNEMRFWNGVNEARISDGGAFVDASDESIKKDIADIEYGIDTVKSLKPRKYKLKSSDVEQVGFIAQEMEVHVPEVVFTGITPDGNEQKGIAYGQLTAVLTKAIQEQQTLIEALTARITALENA
jgi:hypothetical protein